MNQRDPESAQKAVDEAVDQVVQQGGTVHEDAIWDATEAALDGASPEVLVRTINGTATEKYRPKTGWRVVVGNN